MSNGQTQKAFKVMKIDELTRISETRGIEKYYRHQIKTKGGIILTVDIDEEDFTPEKSAPILEAKATNADKIKAL